MATLTSFDGVELHYDDEGSGTPVVLLHGFTSSTQGNWQRPGIWMTLVEEGRRVFVRQVKYEGGPEGFPPAGRSKSLVGEPFRPHGEGYDRRDGKRNLMTRR